MFRLREAGLHHRGIAVPHLFAPAAELLLDAIEAPPGGGSALCLEPGGPVLFRAAALHPSLRETRLVLAGSEHDATRQGALAMPGNWLLTDPWFLPVRTQSCDLVLANLLLGDAEMDAALLREFQRVLRPGGQLVATVLLAGTFEEFFDLTQEYCENQGLVEGRAALSDERSNLYRPPALQRSLETRGFEAVRLGIENRAAPFGNGFEFIEDPVVRNVFLADWMRTLSDPRLRQSTLAGVAQFIDTYFAGIGFTARLVTGVITGRRR
ncbi:MAG: methyltransferase domain-containing protein [Pseudomonadota bacterium]